ncbi:carboxymuconolactone decarboxylase family protein [Halochromatium glycolicum]|uniref:Carboxymuconolactone decarboxylase n=1 Tax=Halochromatium glycolicum TaxID=85075 RepID=A0AAJ0U5E6_9GAMM|nr:carboxymuconolactone decarboxylase family protein [Halochromatium glycolicum]MBK1705527.1 carboxymuconolactone decarboxylase [Halochromatium glycolicum]
MQSRFPYHDTTSAPQEAVAALTEAERQFGMLPNLMRKMATAPALLKGYLALGELFEQTSFSPAEQQIVLLSVSRENRCGYCMGAHSVLADMAKVPQEVTDALRAGQPLPDPRLEALRRFTTAVVEARGWVDESEVAAFQEAGYDAQQVLEVVLGVGMKTLSNYTNHIAGTELDASFQHRAWRASEAG